MKIIVSGCCGFIGSHVCEFLLKRGDTVIGIDNMNDYYDIKIKKLNLSYLVNYDNFKFYKEDVMGTKLISQYKPDKICHLAAATGVRHSIENAPKYIRENIEAFVYVLDEAVNNNVKSVVYASSSSVYGLNKTIPFKETDIIEKCNSPYACSKRCMEVFANTYNQLYGISLIGLRFFTVYGPRGRPDMAPYKFLNAIQEGSKFNKYGDGSSSRDYTYVSDIVDGIVSSIDNNSIQCDVFNLGNSTPITLNEFINTCEEVTGKKAIYDVLEDQLGDVPHTLADISKSNEILNYEPKVSLKDGLYETSKYMLSINEKDVFCVLGDCNKEECHHCYPVTNCSKNHDYCNENGICKEV